MAAGDLITRPWHIEWRSTLLGWPLTDITIADFRGWLELTPARTVMVDRGGRHGSYAGQQTFGARLIEAQLRFLQADYAALRALRAALAPADDPAEEPLAAWFGTDAPEVVWARVERAAIPTDRDFSLGDHRATVQWTASSAFRQSTQMQAAAVTVGQSGNTGLAWPLAFPLDWGDRTATGELTMVNTGNAVAWPVFTITGPTDGQVSITHAATGRRLRFAPSFFLAAGEQITVDTDARHVSQAGIGRDDLLIERGWFGVDPNGAPTTVVFTAPSGSLSAQWRHTSSL
jgi:hypothetical protein